ncbi:MAG: glycosyltransferase family 2 protein [Tepidisphaeraceae bacterium]|jgi:dolichol-phosphate mannosyltransferase
MTQATSALRILVATFAFNEGEKIKTTTQRILAATNHDVLVMDDGSTDGSIDAIRSLNVKILTSPVNVGIGAMMKRAFQYAIDQHYDVIVIMAGNNKDDPTQIPRLLEPIAAAGADFVQGSRHMAGGQHGGMPLYRRAATRLHPLLFSIAARKWVTESTNGFRAIRVEVLRDPRLNWRQEWLNQYELEPYVLFKTIRLGYKHVEVPVTKIYPSKSLGYTKMKPFSGWWSILKPVIYLGLGLRR